MTARKKAVPEVAGRRTPAQIIRVRVPADRPPEERIEVILHELEPAIDHLLTVGEAKYLVGALQRAIERASRTQ